MLKLPHLLKNISPEECKDLRNYYIKYIDKKTDVIKLLDLAIKKREDEEFFDDLEKVCKKYFPNSSVKTIYNSFSQLYLMAEDWIVLQQLRKNQNQKDSIIQEWYHLNGLDELATKKYQIITEKIEKSEAYNIQDKYVYFYSQFMYLFLSSSINTEEREVITKKLREDFLDYLGPILSLMKLEFANLKRIHHFGLDDEIDALDTLLNNMENFENKEILLNLYYSAVNFDFDAFKMVSNYMFSEKIENNSIFEKIIFDYLRQSISKIYKTNNKLQIKDLQPLIEFGLSNDLFFKKESMNIMAYHNLVALIAVQFSLEDTNKFILKTISKVNEKVKESCKVLAKAQNNFYHHKFKEAAKELKRIVFTDASQKRMADVIFLMCIFTERKKERELYETTFASFSYYLKRNETKMSKANYINYTNLLQFMRNVDKSNNYEILSPIGYRSFCIYVEKNKC